LRLHRLRAPALQAVADSSFRSGESLADRTIERGIPRFEDHTWQTTHYDFDLAYLIDAAPGSIYIFDTDTYPLNRVCKLPQLRAQLFPKAHPFLFANFGSQEPDVRGNQRGSRATGLNLNRPREPSRKRRSRRSALKLVKDIGSRYDPNKLTIVQHGQAADPLFPD
jgi:hypothetical protein